MKNFVFIALFSFILNAQAAVLTPFSLEGIEAVNVTVLGKDKLFEGAFKQTLKDEVEKKLHALNIKTTSKSFSNFLIKVKTVTIEKSTLYYVTLSLVESVRISRDKTIEAIAITYTKEDSFESTNPEEDVKESILYLVEEFAEQYKDENTK
ncbi:MAG: hypothetical protein PHN18_12575 [Sulfurospirillaceae bacterium]|nr:hypothetical protein [Sulfurospirillaceae bacterium]MDD2827698.1 hypothetical protein [Sulfurospirillaceae bacterium]